jgi:hypothetical protein
MTGRPSFFTMIASVFATGSYLISSLIMIVISYAKYDEYSAGCSFLAALEHFFLLAYFFWLLIVVLMNYFTVKFELKNFDRWFIPLSVLAFGKYSLNNRNLLTKIRFNLVNVFISNLVIPLLISSIIFFIQFAPGVVPYKIDNNM